MNVMVLVRKAEAGGFWAEVPALPGCVTQAETILDLQSNIREAIASWIAAGEETATKDTEVERMTVTI